MKKIVIIGAGQLGSRHLQSLNLLNQEIEIDVIDPSLESLEIAKTRFDATIQDVKHKISYAQSIPNQQSVDIAIIASTANSRRTIIENLLNKTEVRHLVLEKLLFTQEQDYYEVAKQLSSKDMKVWVNCTMRMMPYYQHLNTAFKNEVVQYHVNGSQYGLVTNAIHYLDHLAYITGSDQFEIDTRYLDKQIIPSKRNGYFELTGTLVARFENGSTAFLHCDKNGMAPIQIEIYNHNLRVISREWEQKAWQTSLEKDWKWEEVNAPIPYQSMLTAELVTTLLETGSCNLTSYEISMQHHLQLLGPLKEFLLDNKLNSEIDYPFT
ncbi:Gfo/Idh/MocA family oxidoreductase [Legionella pneumophila]|uniref:Gfo/Idh/MocA family oxidoreductase n=1 Tax=Legionella pneumophila TaxID=446 RepID=UPI00048439E1|nr:Gfo/Idh/MocA family oxidoreductase [Legionella pneumophila]MCK1850609.1 Gfo/Idh/MocA family oxidoreductase [Legionella pneumophila]MCZ4805479.1 Gfo/Idh/MocA family oxidoreductase [Legionella pneumophila]MDI9851380.1 Gfo/Idh/MocA family oxidoreductase [Legionella pneumophila]MDW8866302.1 Gfo/Idh/MocA family oxidoreductase [Legionella pneumophila]MDW9135373.1 Gfo/Idh/MocA family oxidoreductase [Legionella pneumophila]